MCVPRESALCVSQSAASCGVATAAVASDPGVGGATLVEPVAGDRGDAFVASRRFGQGLGDRRLVDVIQLEDLPFPPGALLDFFAAHGVGADAQNIHR